MKAWRIHRFGGADALTLDEIEQPKPSNGGVLVRIHATSVNPVDYKTREGKFPMLREDKLPLVLGRDVAGTVEVAGGGFEQGERVYGMPDFEHGSYAQFIVMQPQMLARVREKRRPGDCRRRAAGCVDCVAGTV